MCTADMDMPKSGKDNTSDPWETGKAFQQRSAPSMTVLKTFDQYVQKRATACSFLLWDCLRRLPYLDELPHLHMQ